MGICIAGADKFSETFLGEFDTPEAIWNHEMRQLMIQKIASHISDFTPRLLSNTKATYQVSVVRGGQGRGLIGFPSSCSIVLCQLSSTLSWRMSCFAISSTYGICVIHSAILTGLSKSQ